MVDFTFEELKEYLSNFFEKVRINEYESSSIITATRCFYEYEPIMKDGITEHIVCSLTIGQLLQKAGNRIFITHFNIVKDAVEKVLYQNIEFDLSKEDKIKLLHLARWMNDALPKMEIEYNPKAR